VTAQYGVDDLEIEILDDGSGSGVRQRRVAGMA